MRHFALALLVVAVLAAPAFATHNHPQVAKGMKLTLASAYEPCTSPITAHAPTIGLPACNPEVLTTSANATNQITFGPLGKIAAALKVVPGDIKVIVKGKDILNNSAPYTGSLMMTANLRLTDHNCLPPIFPNPCTVQDFAMLVPVTCTAGACSASTSFNTLNAGWITPLQEMNFEVGQIVIEDPDGDEAFRQGLFVP
jgi:hypothetical protein